MMREGLTHWVHVVHVVHEVPPPQVDAHLHTVHHIVYLSCSTVSAPVHRRRVLTDLSLHSFLKTTLLGLMTLGALAPYKPLQHKSHRVRATLSFRDRRRDLGPARFILLQAEQRKPPPRMARQAPPHPM
ncbi:hypothetical protein EYF80_060653 [Liparis tanakae]|uniref:Uncharacterized protein n=1 Tax=Liparis tanakae TaxID=230148 RepID=A0A4Z2EKT8_9TELE|nr:hypothetical protein EYF80_060653 [Liparis tanakae]